MAQDIADLPGYMDDFVPYTANAEPGRGRSIYDECWRSSRCDEAEPRRD